MRPSVTLEGRYIGDFLLLEQIGAGGYSYIYRARQDTLERDVVLKLMRWSGMYDQDATERFLYEAQLASQLDHPYAAHIYGFGAEPDGLLWIAMELVRGTSLGDLLTAQGSLALARFVPLLEKICEVVYQAHEQGIVHRDIKPGNVMVIARAGRLLPKLLDLGIAHLVDESVDRDGAQGRAASEPPFLAGSELPDVPDDTPGDMPDEPDEERHVGRATPRATPVSRTDPNSLGSPPYMAPEQWISAARCGPRSDQYSLAILAYEAIVGHPPFQRSTPTAYARAHLRESVPPLDERFPPQLSAVLTRALAKNQEERYPDVLAFAQAFRTAAGLEAEVQLAPRLPTAVREPLLARAPQPLADSVALLETARDPVRALEAAFQVVRVAVRLVAHYAIAALTRFPPAEHAHHDGIRTALRRMRSRFLTTRDWLDIAHALAIPYAERPDIHPLPELVLLFEHTDASAESDTTDDMVDDAADDATDDTASRETNDETVFDLLTRVEACAQGEEPERVIEAMVPALARLLERLLFLCEYRMVVRYRGRDETWEGERRAVRREVRVRGGRDALMESEVALIGSADELLLALSPLCRLRAPAPGEPEEIFLFDGRSRYGARLVSFPIGFEWHDGEFWDWYEEQRDEFNVAGADDDTGTGEGSRAPYKGLSAFSPEDADNYFGREREVTACVNRLRVAPLLVVVGPSGAGKSSFVQAGIIPALPENWHALTVRPGPAPMDALAARLVRHGVGREIGLTEADDMRSYLESDAEALARVLSGYTERMAQTLVLVIDQFEELVTLGSQHDERDHYAEALVRAAQSGQSAGDMPGPAGVRVILTLRDDFLLRAQALPALRQELGRSLQLLATPPPDELERVLIEPARRAGYEFENRDLPREMVAAIADEPGALALLSFTASRLWEVRDRHFRKLRVSAYRTLGGVGGALAQHAEACLAAMPTDQQALVREVFRQLVTADGTRAVLSRDELIDILGDEERANAVLEALIGARLLVASEGAAGEDRIEVVHEALLSSWPRLVGWQREDAESARLRDQLRTAARQWTARDRAKGMLWRGDALLEYRVWRARYRGSLTSDEEDFARASLAAETRFRRLRRALLASAFAVLVAGLLVVLSLERQARVERERAQTFAAESEERLLDLYVEQGRLALLGGDAERAFAYLAGALREGAESHALRFMLARAAHALDDQIMVLNAHRGLVFALAFSPDGSVIATGGDDHLVKLWDSHTGALRWTQDVHTDAVWMLDFSADGSRLVSASWDGTARMWDSSSGTLVWTAQQGGMMRWAGFNHAGDQLATVSINGTVTLRAAADGRPIHVWEHPKPLLVARFSNDDARLAAGSSVGVASVFDVESGQEIATLQAGRRPISSLDFSPDDQFLALAGDSRDLHIAPSRGGDVRTIVAHDERINRAIFLPDSATLVTASADHTARIWDVTTAQPNHALKGHDSGVTNLALSPDGRFVATTSRDATVGLWDLQDGTHMWTFLGHKDAVWDAIYDPQGSRLATASFDGTVRLWNPRKRLHELVLPTQDTDIQYAAFSPDGTHIATARGDVSRDRAIVEIWSLRGELLKSFEHPFAITYFTRLSLAWHPDGREILLSGGPRAVSWVLEDDTKREYDAAHGDITRHAIYTSDGSSVLTAGDDGTIKRWDPSGHSATLIFEGHEGPVTTLDANARHIVSGSVDETTRLWDARVGQPLQTWKTSPPQSVNTVRFSPDGRHVISAAEDKNVTLWTVGESDARTLEGHTNAVPGAAFSPDGQLIATGSADGTIKIWDMTTDTQLFTTTPLLVPVASVVFSPDGRLLVAAQGHTAKIWSLHPERRTWQELRRFAACRTDFQLVNGRLERSRRNDAECARPDALH